MEVTRIEGVTPSARLREELAGQTVILAFSRGKDSLAAWLALRDAGVKVVPYHMHLVPGLRFVEESLAYFADWFGVGPIVDIPHPSLFRWLANMTFQTPERCQIIEAAAPPVPEYTDYNRLIRDHFGLPADAWVCDGVRAADSPNRRMALKAHGPINHNGRTMKVVWDWRVGNVREAIGAEGVQLPRDYEWFGRSFDGLDRRFLQPLKDHAPDDYQTILDWFPLAELELLRGSL
jgi:hypothetical protein